MTLCKGGSFVKSIPSKILRPATYSAFRKHQEQIGYDFDCELSDVVLAMKDVYQNYNWYLEEAKKAQIWIEQYLPKS